MVLLPRDLERGIRLGALVVDARAPDPNPVAEVEDDHHRRLLLLLQLLQLERLDVVAVLVTDLLTVDVQARPDRTAVAAVVDPELELPVVLALLGRLAVAEVLARDRLTAHERNGPVLAVRRLGAREAALRDLADRRVVPLG